MKNVKEIIDDITSKWFLREPFLFSMFCTHKLVENSNMDCCIRSGKMRIEYNSSRLTAYSRDEIDNLLRREVLRIILKHPYQRQPVCVVPKLAYLASNLTIFLHGGTGINPIKSDIYNLLLDHIQNDHPSFEELYRILIKCGVNAENADVQNHNGEDQKHNDSHAKKSWPPHEINGEINEVDEQNESNEGHDDKENSDTQESSSDSNNLAPGSFSENSSENDEYDNQKGDREEKGVSCLLKDVDANQSNTGDGENIACRQTSDSGIDENKDATALWEDNPLFAERINCSILETDDNNWGTLVGNIQSLIKVSTKRAENLMRRLEMFRTSILSTGQCCTRMRPSRRYGWVQMGKRHPYCSRLLLGIDTSGSIEDNDLRKFLSIINSFFSVGFPEIDVLMFDTTIHLPVIKLSSAKDTFKIIRGGTDFTDIIEYYKDNRQYDGLIMFTDGYAPLPVVPKGRKVLWALKNRRCYEDFKLQPKIYLPD